MVKAAQSIIPKGSALRTALTVGAFNICVLVNAFKLYTSPDALVPGFENTLEYAFTKTMAKRILSQWSPSERIYFTFGIGLDTLYICAYSFLYMFLCLRHEEDDIYEDIATLQYLLGLAHFGQNWFMLQTVAGFPNDIEAKDPFFMGICATIKAGLFFAVWAFVAWNEYSQWMTKVDWPEKLIIRRQVAQEKAD